MPLETSSALPWKCPSNQLFPTQEFPFAPEESPRCRSRESSQLLLATLQWHRASDTLIRSHQWSKRHRAVSILQNATPFNTHTAMRRRVGTLLWSVLYRYRIQIQPISSTKPLLSPRNTFALDSVLLNFSWVLFRTRNGKVSAAFTGLSFPTCVEQSALLSYFLL